MSDLYFYNTLTRDKEKFEPIDSKNVRMYVCGPTVYGDLHIGNTRSAIAFDLLYRVLIKAYGKENVVYVRNITDIDDKINNEVKKQNISQKELTEKVIATYHSNLKSLSVSSPNFEPKVSENISEIIDLISNLIDKKNAYVKNDHVFFDVSSYKKYGELSNQNIEKLLEGVRVENSEDKDNPLDFVLWKPSDDETIGFDSPWGYGRPGWHIECSAMSLKYLGETFDIHGGGLDLIFPHHENEIAQSICATQKKFSNFWIHNGLINMNNEKMSKSLGNIITTNDLLKEWDGAVIRLAMLSSHYRSEINWNSKLLLETQEKITKWANLVKDLDPIEPDSDFFESLYDDLNTPKAMAYLSMVHKQSNSGDVLSAQKLLGAANFLGIDLKSFYNKLKNSGISDEEIENNLNLRNQYRKENNFEKADEIRNLLKEKGVELKDGESGTTWYRV